MKRSIIFLFFWVVVLAAVDYKVAPDFTLKDLTGQKVSLYEELEKGPVLLDFWATWCTACKEEMPIFENLHKKYQDKGLQIFLVSIDKRGGVSKAKSYIKSEGFTSKALFDKRNKVYKSFSQANDPVPYAIIINQNKEIVFSFRGKAGIEIFEKEIEKLFK